HNLKGEEDQELIQWINSPTNGSNPAPATKLKRPVPKRRAFLRSKHKSWSLNVCTDNSSASGRRPKRCAIGFRPDSGLRSYAVRARDAAGPHNSFGLTPASKEAHEKRRAFLRLSLCS